MTRLPAGGRIDRESALTFEFNGRFYSAHPGDTLASALLANGVHRVASSVELGRPRGIMTAGISEPCALVQLQAPVSEPMLTATTVELFQGLQAIGLPGRGRLSDAGDEPVDGGYDRMHLHCDVLVVGAGPAGLLAALTAARAGARLVLLDDQPEPGGELLNVPAGATDWIAAVTAELASTPGVRVLARTTAFGSYDDGFVLARQKLTDHLPAGERAGRLRQRVWRIRARQLVLATGAHERPVVFADNDRPGIMLAGAGRAYLNRYGVLAGDRIVLFTADDSAYPAVIELAEAGAAVTVLDAREQISQFWQGECSARLIELRAGTVVMGTSGSDGGRISGVRLGDRSGGFAGDLACDLLLVSGGWNPALQLWGQAGGRLRYDPAAVAFLPQGELAGVRVTGAAAGRWPLADCLRDGRDQALAALAELGLSGAEAAPDELPTVADQHGDRPDQQPTLALFTVPDDGTDARRFVDLQRDATVADIRRATGAGLRSAEHVKRYTTIGTAHDQGKTSGVIASAIVADALGLDLAELGITSARPPYTPIAFAALAGRDRGAIFDPARISTIHRWHIEHGARFENVGQWKRPWYYPNRLAAGELEDLDAAVTRESVTARTSVGMMDASTLGKITVQGPDAGEFLDRIYTNLMSSLKPGSIRYGLMCGLDGMVIDDGTVMRISATEFVLTTTTGNAALVLDWLEEFAQTEWPQLRVWLTSVTEHWSTIALVGPNSRHVLAELAPDLDVSKEGFGFMTWRAAVVAGIAARVCRISFSGELAYELNVPSWYGQALWQAVWLAGQPYGITPYGTETMHLLRAEKGYPIIGQDTDGTVTPQDLGMDWVVSKKKLDFIGKRSFSRAENQRPDRKQLIGLLPVDGHTLLDEGAQLLAEPVVAELPARMLGHVTSSYRSAALGSSFALALLRSGRERLGQTVYAWQDGVIVPATVTGPVLYDPEGARRDG